MLPTCPEFPSSLFFKASTSLTLHLFSASSVSSTPHVAKILQSHVFAGLMLAGCEKLSFLLAAVQTSQVIYFRVQTPQELMLNVSQIEAPKPWEKNQHS